ncbi:rhomboid family intramembrane serine protease [Thioclava sp. BHET1]|nr:rhomboid family intramembrane serine protease [Thioclava sp. BHET1]
MNSPDPLFETAPPRGPLMRLLRWGQANPVTAAILILCILPEAVLEGADAGLWGTSDWRLIAFSYGAFIPQLFHGTIPNYALQPEAMFLSYGFLHGGFAHIALNMLSFVSLAAPVSQRLGQRRYALLYLISLLGGGLGTALLAPPDSLMIGASGAIFGLFGALLGWNYSDRRAIGQSPMLILKILRRPLLIVIGLNLALYLGVEFFSQSELAWQAHLGGFLAGWLGGLWLDPHRRRRRLA